MRRMGTSLRGWPALRALNGQAQTHSLQNRRKAAEFRIPLRRERAVELCWIEASLVGNSLYTSKRLRHLTQCDQQLGLVAIPKNVVEQFQGVFRVFAEPF